MVEKNNKTGTKDIPPEILCRILLFTNRRCIPDFLSSPKVIACLSKDHNLWNSYCGTTDLSIDTCKSLLRKRISLAKNIRNAAECLRTFKTDQSDMTQLQIHGNLIYSASDDQSIKAFGMNGEFSKKFVGHSGGIWSFDMAGDMLVTGSTDKTTRIWSVVHGNAVHTLRVHRSTVRAVRLHSGYVVTASRDSTIAVWRLNGSLQHILLGHIQSVRCVDMDSQYVLSGSYDCSVKLWDYRRGQLVRDMPSHRKRVYVVKLYNGYAASGGLDSEVKVSKISGETVLGHSLHKSLVLWLDFAGRYLISSSLDGLIVNYDYINRRVLYTIQETSMIKHQKVYSDFLLIGTAVEAKIYSLRTGKLIRTLLSTYMITRVDMNENVIVVGYSYEGDCYISIFDYRFSKQI